MPYNSEGRFQCREDFTALDILVCGEICLIKNQRRVCLTCTFCGHEMLSLGELLKHSIGTHLSYLEGEQISYDLDCLRCQTQHGRNSIYPSFSSNNVVESMTVSAIKSPVDDFVKVESFENKQEEFASNSDDLISDLAEGFASSDFVDNCIATSISNEILSDALDFELVLFDSDLKKPTQMSNTPIREENVQQKVDNHEFKNFEGPEVCLHCNRIFEKASELQEHLKDNCKEHKPLHMIIKPYKCTVCDKSFINATRLNSHQRTHTGERPFKCKECGKSYTNASNLATHQRRHTNERPYLCSICGKSFVDIRGFRQHQPSHSDERPFVCGVCNASFKRSKALRNHSKIHSGIKAYACQLCPKRFAQNSGLSGHMKSHAHKAERFKRSKYYILRDFV